MDLAQGHVHMKYSAALTLVSLYISVFAIGLGYKSYLQAKIGIQMNYQFRKKSCIALGICRF